MRDKVPLKVLHRRKEKPRQRFRSVLFGGLRNANRTMRKLGAVCLILCNCGLPLFNCVIRFRLAQHRQVRAL